MSGTARAALVTGASSGIGLSVTETLLKDGHAVTICGRDPERLATAAERLRPWGDLQSVTADVTDPDDVRRLVAEHEARFGRLDVLVNNAGAAVAGPLAAPRSSSSTWRSPRTCARRGSSRLRRSRC